MRGSANACSGAATNSEQPGIDEIGAAPADRLEQQWVAGQLTVEAKPPASVSAVIGRRADCPKMRPSVAKAGS